MTNETQLSLLRPSSLWPTLGRVARMLVHTMRHSGVVLSVVGVFGLLAFALAARIVADDHNNGNAAFVMTIPVFFWWVAAGEFLLLRAPPSTLALVPSFQRLNAAVVALHLAWTTLFPAALLVPYGADFSAVVAANLLASGIGAVFGQRPKASNVLLLVLAVLAFILNQKLGPAGTPERVGTGTIAIELVFGALLLGDWWRSGIGARPERRWHEWTTRVLRMHLYEQSSRRATLVTGASSLHGFVRLEAAAFRALDAFQQRRFATAPDSRSARLAILSLGLGRLRQRAVATALAMILCAVFMVTFTWAMGRGDAPGLEMVALLLIALAHAGPCAIMPVWRSAEMREPELLWLLPRLDPTRRFGALTAGLLSSVHLRVLLLNALMWLWLAYFLDLGPARIAFGLLWLSLVATLATAFCCALLGPLRWSRLAAGALAYGAPLVGYVFAWRGLVRDGANTLCVLAIVFTAALLLLWRMRDLLRTRANPFSPA